LQLKAGAKRRWTLAVAVAALLVGGTVLSSRANSTDSQGLPKGQVTSALLKTRAEGHLFYPGARVLTQHGADERQGGFFEGALPATIAANVAACGHCPKRGDPLVLV
jgi:hypothetical protein